MGCIIGMTKDAEQRKTYWKNQYPELKRWQVFSGPIRSTERAKKMATELALEYDCTPDYAEDEHAQADAQWYIYGFKY
ncbi:hypothetical protein ACFL3D_00920 [Candidatus Omnitrophota bacterium]